MKHPIKTAELLAVQPEVQNPQPAGGGILHIITPVKDSVDLALETAASVLASRCEQPFIYTLYDDFSTPENSARLEAASRQMGFELRHLAEMTDTPSPNYRLILDTARRRALDAGAQLLIVESDVTVAADTVQRLVDGAAARPDCALAAAITTDSEGEANYPYEAWRCRTGVLAERHHLSFCCTLLTRRFLATADFGTLDPKKSWYDVTISHWARQLGFANYLFCDIRVRHRPHGSRPWKQLKYANRFKYYLEKLRHGRDKI